MRVRVTLILDFLQCRANRYCDLLRSLMISLQSECPGNMALHELISSCTLQQLAICFDLESSPVHRLSRPVAAASLFSSSPLRTVVPNVISPTTTQPQLEQGKEQSHDMAVAASIKSTTATNRAVVPHRPGPASVNTLDSVRLSSESLPVSGYGIDRGCVE